MTNIYISFVSRVTMSCLLPGGRWKVFFSETEWSLDQSDQLETAALLIRWKQPNALYLRLDEDLNDSNIEFLRKFLTAANIHYTGVLGLGLDGSHDSYQTVPEDILLQINRGR